MWFAAGTVSVGHSHIYRHLREQRRLPDAAHTSSLPRTHIGSHNPVQSRGLPMSLTGISQRLLKYKHCLTLSSELILAQRADYSASMSPSPTVLSWLYGIRDYFSPHSLPFQRLLLPLDSICKYILSFLIPVAEQPDEMQGLWRQNRI